VREWLNDNVLQTLKIHSNSPDLNVLEEVWLWMKSYVELKKPTTIDDLEWELEQAWYKVTVKMCNSYIDDVYDKLP